MLVEGGVEEFVCCNVVKVVLVYGVIDVFGGFYCNDVVLVVCLCMNILFFLFDDMFNVCFVSDVKVVGLLVLKGYKVVGGICVLFYNVMLVEGVCVLVVFMCDF